MACLGAILSPSRSSHTAAKPDVLARPVNSFESADWDCRLQAVLESTVDSCTSNAAQGAESAILPHWSDPPAFAMRAAADRRPGSGEPAGCIEVVFTLCTKWEYAHVPRLVPQPCQTGFDIRKGEEGASQAVSCEFRISAARRTAGGSLPSE